MSRKDLRCEVHDVDLIEQDVPIQYGLVMPEPGFFEAQAALFPHADEPRMGGCVVHADMPRHERDLVCPTCCEARDAWRRAHPHP